MRKYIIFLALALALVVSTTTLVMATQLTQQQIDAVVGLLKAFGADESTINNTKTVLSGGSSTQLAIVPVLQSGSSNIPKLTLMLTVGSRGDAVKILQSLLAADPSVYPEGFITGFYGPITANAVRKYQKKEGLSEHGKIDEKTLEKLNKHLSENELDMEDSDDKREGKRPCAIVPPGHLIAPGWLKKNKGERPIVPPCQKLPPGIWKKYNGGATTTPDLVAPVISNLTATSTNATTAQITWATNELSSTKVWYATSTPVVVARPLYRSSVSTLVLSHLLNLTGLTASTTYNYLAISTDAGGNTATSTSQLFQSK